MTAYRSPMVAQTSTPSRPRRYPRCRDAKASARVAELDGPHRGGDDGRREVHLDAAAGREPSCPRDARANAAAVTGEREEARRGLERGIGEEARGDRVNPVARRDVRGDHRAQADTRSAAPIRARSTKASPLVPPAPPEKTCAPSPRR